MVAALPTRRVLLEDRRVKPMVGEEGEHDQRDDIGIDLAKNVFQAHGASMAGQIKFRRKLTRQQFRRFMAEQLPATVVMEACGSAHYWARDMPCGHRFV